MRALSLCQSCKRHIRQSESVCPFCGAAHTAASVSTSAKPRGRPGGRAALFLAGAAAIPGCADEPQPVPVYGIPIDDAAVSAPDGGKVDGGAVDAGKDSEPMAQPVYGVPIEVDAGTGANTCGTPPPPMAVPVYGVPVDASAARDAASDATCGDDGGPLIAPVYGVPVDPHKAADSED